MNYPWLADALSSFTAACLAGRMPQAVLLVGPEGIGLEAMAKAMAEVALCESLSETGACGTCRGCQLFAANNHPDCAYVTLIEKSRLIKVDQVRQLTHTLNQTAQFGRQVAIIHPAHQLNTAAANALLKTLEEPSGSVLLVLTAPNRSLLPATVSSRTQVVDLTLHDPSLALAWLAEQFPNESADALLRLCSGGPLLAEGLLAQGYRQLSGEIVGLLKQSVVEKKNTLPSVPALVKHDSSLLLRALSGIVSDIVKQLLGIGQAHLTHVDLVDDYAAMLPHLEVNAVQLYFDHVNQAVAQVNSGVHVNLQLLWERLFVLWRNVGKLRNVLC